MKKVFIYLSIVFLLLVGVASAETVTFQWNQTDLTSLKEWKLFWSGTHGGPYVELATIAYDGSSKPLYTSPAEVPVTGNPATNVIKYFVLIACGDIPQADGSNKYMCSADSNEANHSFWIPAGMFSVPLNFDIVPN